MTTATAEQDGDQRAPDEQDRCALADVKLLARTDMLVLTGQTCGFDRLLHLTAYART